MMPRMLNEQVQVPPPAYHRAQGRLGPALHIDALTLIRTLHLLALCPLAVRLSHRRCAPPLPAAYLSGGVHAAHRALTYSVATVLPGYARLVSGLACTCPGLRLAAESQWAAALVSSSSWVVRHQQSLRWGTIRYGNPSAR